MPLVHRKSYKSLVEPMRAQTLVLALTNILMLYAGQC